jgi:hypothetical protein
MKKHLMFSAMLIVAACLLSCKKDVNDLKFTITGRLVESSSNPIPISNYKLQINQRDDYGLLGGVAGTTTEFETDGNGNFSITYTPKKGTGFSSGNPNGYPLSITGIDNNKYKGLYPDWYPIPANKDTTLNTIYLYKKIERFVRKIQLNAALANNDSLEVITSTAYRSTYKTLYGPIPEGTVLTLDTINQFKVERFDIHTGSYSVTTVLKKHSYQQNFSLKLPKEDEVYREQLLLYQ